MRPIFFKLGKLHNGTDFYLDGNDIESPRMFALMDETPSYLLQNIMFLSGKRDMVFYISTSVNGGVISPNLMFYSPYSTYSGNPIFSAVSKSENRYFSGNTILLIDNLLLFLKQLDDDALLHLTEITKTNMRKIILIGTFENRTEQREIKKYLHGLTTMVSSPVKSEEYSIIAPSGERLHFKV